MACDVTDLDRARRLIDEASTVVSFSGAGLSAESGIATFRDPDGVWSKIDPAIYASEAGFRSQPEEVSRWYAHRRRTLASTGPNAAHLALAASGWHSHITQNVDNLLEQAGAQHVTHLHGVLDHDRCQDRCGYRSAVDLTDPPILGTCPRCGSLLRPDVVWFGETLPEPAWASAGSAIEAADVTVVIGTSGEVWPAAGLIDRARTVITVNQESTPVGRRAAVELIGMAATVIPSLLSPGDPSTR